MSIAWSDSRPGRYIAGCDVLDRNRTQRRRPLAGRVPALPGVTVPWPRPGRSRCLRPGPGIARDRRASRAPGSAGCILNVTFQAA